MEEDLKIKAMQFVEIPFVQAQLEPVEIPLELTKSAGFKDTVSYSDNSLNTGGFWKTLIPNPVCKITQ
jgi:hypothetical protein